jgi:Putative polyhydroxyalkanoic acid system protein (PHA_gran_rgn)
MGIHKVPFFALHQFAIPPFRSLSNYIRLGQLEDLKMSAPLIVSIPHQLGREEATRRLKAGLTRAASSIPVLKVDEERWEENRMIFRVRALGQAASGHLDVADDHVRLEVTLPWLLQRFAEVAQTAIKNRGNLLLTKRG